MKKQAGFAEPHSSSTIGWVWVGLSLGWGCLGVGLEFVSDFGWGQIR